MLLLSLYLPIIILPLFFKHKRNILFLSLIYEFLFLYKLEILIFFRIYIYYYDILSALLGFMGGISNSIFIALLKLFVSSLYITLFIRFYNMSDGG